MPGKRAKRLRSAEESLLQNGSGPNVFPADSISDAESLLQPTKSEDQESDPDYGSPIEQYVMSVYQFHIMFIKIVGCQTEFQCKNTWGPHIPAVKSV